MGLRRSGKRTIGLVVPSFSSTGGVASVAEFIIRAIERRSDFDLRIISLATSSRDPCSLLATDPRTWFRGVTSRTCTSHTHDFVHVGALFGEFEFQRLAKRPELERLLDGCDLIQVVAGTPCWALPVADLGKPVVLQVATMTTVERRLRLKLERGPLGIWRAFMTRLVDPLDEAGLRAVDAVMVENPWMKEYATTAVHGSGTLVHYAPPGVDTEIFRPSQPGERGAAEPYILAVGRLADVRKNMVLLLRAYALLVERVQSAPNLLLAGADGPTADFWVEAEAKKVRDRITFVKRPSAAVLAGMYRHAVCLALPSDEEGFGIVVIEAMASGIPVVSTRSGGPEGIITDGVDGFLVDRNDVAAMADRLQQLVLAPDDARAMGRRSRATIEAHYADNVAGDVYTNLYDQLLAAH